ncbi:hypothetical protein DFR79_10888 [Halanaerobium saccharolyticum]|uniref:Cyclic nucleotide-binding domain-containing protein n=1 Tax=Halanaerobium saccharolyticum TaxID=43595 RepID=A0A4R6LTT6_9FIRM|nr:DUF2225 domain-containing protein [Halanaerobium saccharolyticum]TDO92062.1 hypothetical protein DFR79_10888 [Halanaerobium saccharolyticum]
MSEKNNFKDLLAKYSNLKEFKTGSELYSYQEKADKIYFILSGLIRIYIKDNEQELEIQRQKNGSFVGVTAFTANTYSSRAAVYLDTKALEFKVSDLRKIMQRNNSFASKMINSLSLYIEKLENRNEEQLTPISKINKKIETEKEIKKTLAAEKIAAKKKGKFIDQAAAKIRKQADFYLNGHSFYDQKAAKEDQYYLYDKEIECPVCFQKMEIKKIRNSRLRIEEIRADLRPLYKNFNLYNYSVLSCPRCLFTARRNDFYDFSKRRMKKIKNNFKKNVSEDLGSDFKIEYDELRTINQVLDAHYLALKLYDFTDYHTDKKAFIWRDLSWIYEDLGETNLSEKASLKALKNLEEFYFKEDTNSTKTESDNITLLLAVLYHKHNKSDKALPLLDELIRDNRVSLRQRNKAKDLFLEIREAKRNS